jgi:hypothetical protein
MNVRKAFRWGIFPALGLPCLFDAVARPIGVAVLVTGALLVAWDWSREVLGEGDKPDRWA